MRSLTKRRRCAPEPDDVQKLCLCAENCLASRGITVSRQELSAAVEKMSLVVDVNFTQELVSQLELTKLKIAQVPPQNLHEWFPYLQELTVSATKIKQLDLSACLRLEALMVVGASESLRLRLPPMLLSIRSDTPLEFCDQAGLAAVQRLTNRGRPWPRPIDLELWSSLCDLEIDGDLLEFMFPQSSIPVRRLVLHTSQETQVKLAGDKFGATVARLELVMPQLTLSRYVWLTHFVRLESLRAQVKNADDLCALANVNDTLSTLTLELADIEISYNLVDLKSVAGLPNLAELEIRRPRQCYERELDLGKLANNKMLRRVSLVNVRAKCDSRMLSGLQDLQLENVSRLDIDVLTNWLANPGLTRIQLYVDEGLSSAEVNALLASVQRLPQLELVVVGRRFGLEDHDLEARLTRVVPPACNVCAFRLRE